MASAKKSTKANKSTNTKKTTSAKSRGKAKKISRGKSSSKVEKSRKGKKSGKKKRDVKASKTAQEQFKAHDRTLPFRGAEAIDTAVLECFDYEYADKPIGKGMRIVTTTDEFTSVCPFSGLPDFACVTISYIPDRLCLELRALKYYLMSYRDVGIWYEHLVNRMLEDLVEACKPREMSISIDVNSRGGLQSMVTASYTASPEE